LHVQDTCQWEFSNLAICPITCPREAWRGRNWSHQSRKGPNP